MSSSKRNGFLVSATIIVLLFASVIHSHAETINYFYDDLHRLIRVEYGSAVTITYTYDQFGNRLTEAIRDVGAPTTTASPVGGVYNVAKTVTLTCSDGYGLGCDKIYYTTNGTTPTTSSPVYSSPINISATTTLKFFARDLAGNSESVKTQVYTIDTAPPTGTILINSGAVSTNSANVTLTLSCSDANGCFQMRFSNDNQTYSTAQTYATTKAWTLTTGDGTKTVYVKFRDTVGNWCTPYNDTILLDTIAPITTASPPGGAYYTAQSVTLTCNDTGGSGCNKIYYTTDGTTPTTASPVYSSPINISLDTALRFFATDLSGNSEPVKSETYDIDIGGAGSVRIGSTSYNTIQSAYNAAISGDVIKCQNRTFNENITVNRNVNVTLDGGYNSDFTTNAGGMTTIKGKLLISPK